MIRALTSCKTCATLIFRLVFLWVCEFLVYCVLQKVQINEICVGRVHHALPDHSGSVVSLYLFRH